MTANGHRRSEHRLSIRQIVVNTCRFRIDYRCRTWRNRVLVKRIFQNAMIQALRNNIKIEKIYISKLGVTNNKTPLYHRLLTHLRFLYNFVFLCFFQAGKFFSFYFSASDLSIRIYLATLNRYDLLQVISYKHNLFKSNNRMIVNLRRDVRNCQQIEDVCVNIIRNASKTTFVSKQDKRICFIHEGQHTLDILYIFAYYPYNVQFCIFML